MTRPQAVVAAVLWLVGMVLLVVALRATDDFIALPDICQIGAPGCSRTGELPRPLIIGTALLGVAGLLGVGLVSVRVAKTPRVLRVVAGLLWFVGVLLLVVGIHRFAPLGVRLFGFPTLSDSLGKLYYGTAAVAVAGLLALGRPKRR